MSHPILQPCFPFAIGSPSSDTRKQISNHHSSRAVLRLLRLGTQVHCQREYQCGPPRVRRLRVVVFAMDSLLTRKPDPLPVVRKPAGSDSCACDTFGQPLRRH